MNAKKTVKSKGPGDVGEFMRELDHPLKRDIEAVRQIILNVDRRAGDERGARDQRSDQMERAELSQDGLLCDRQPSFQGLRPAHLPHGRKGEGHRDDGNQYRRSHRPVEVARQGSLSRDARRRERHSNQAGGV